MNHIEHSPIVAKFGGTSLADADRIKKVVDIIHSNPDRRYIVVSAPGKRHKEDTKITDHLIACNRMASRGVIFDSEFEKVRTRFEEIGKGLKCHNKMINGLNLIYEEINQSIISSNEWRGEWLSAIAVSEYSGLPFVDAKIIELNQNGEVDNRSYSKIKKHLDETRKAVIPGFYASDQKGRITTLPRGGSDITGAYIARSVMAGFYENWTDVNGVYKSDPNNGHECEPIKIITYSRMRQMGQSGANVFHPSATLPLEEADITTIIRNTFNPDHKGTMIVAKLNSVGTAPVLKPHLSHENHTQAPRQYQIYP